MSTDPRHNPLIFSSDVVGGITPSGSAFKIEFDSVGGKSFHTGVSPALYATAKVCPGGYLVATAYPDLEKCVVEPVRILRTAQNSTTSSTEINSRMGNASFTNINVENSSAVSNGSSLGSFLPPPPGFSFTSEVSAVGFQGFRSSFKPVEFTVPSAEEGSITSIQLLVDGNSSASSHSVPKQHKMGPNLYSASLSPLPYVHLLMGTSTGVLVVCDVMRGRTLAIASLANGGDCGMGKTGRRAVAPPVPTLSHAPPVANVASLGMGGNRENTLRTGSRNGKGSSSARVLTSASISGDGSHAPFSQTSNNNEREQSMGSMRSSDQEMVEYGEGGGTTGGKSLEEEEKDRERSFNTPPDTLDTKIRRQARACLPVSLSSPSNGSSLKEGPGTMNAFSYFMTERNEEERRTSATTTPSPPKQEKKSPFFHSDESKPQNTEDDSNEAVKLGVFKLFQTTSSSYTTLSEEQNENKKEEVEKNSAMNSHRTSGGFPFLSAQNSQSRSDLHGFSASSTPEMVSQKEIPPLNRVAIAEDEVFSIVALVPWGYPVEKEGTRGEHSNALACQGIWVVHQGGQMERIKRQALDLFIQTAESGGSKGRRFTAPRPSLKRWVTADTNTVIPAVGPAASFISSVDVLYHAGDIRGWSSPVSSSLSISPSAATTMGYTTPMNHPGGMGFTSTSLWSSRTTTTSNSSYLTPSGGVPSSTVSHPIGEGGVITIPHSSSSMSPTYATSSLSPSSTHRRAIYDAAFFSLATPSTDDDGAGGGGSGGSGGGGGDNPNYTGRKGQPGHGLSCLLLCGTSPSYSVYPLHSRGANWKDNMKVVVNAASRFINRIISTSINGLYPTAPEVMKLNIQRFFSDPQLTFTKVQVDPAQEWAVLYAREAGKIFLVHLSSGSVRRTWTSFNRHRCVQFQFFARRVRQQQRVFLVIHFPSASFSAFSSSLSQEKGALEVYEMQHLQCVCCVSVPEETVLLPSPLLTTAPLEGNGSLLPKQGEQTGGRKGNMFFSPPTTAAGTARGGGSAGIASSSNNRQGNDTSFEGGSGATSGSGEEVIWLEPSSGVIHRLLFDASQFIIQEKDIERRRLREVEELVQEEWCSTLEAVTSAGHTPSSNVGGAVGVRVPGIPDDNEGEKPLLTPGVLEASLTLSSSTLFPPFSSSYSSSTSPVSFSSTFMKKCTPPPLHSPRAKPLWNARPERSRWSSFSEGNCRAGEGGTYEDEDHPSHYHHDGKAESRDKFSSSHSHALIDHRVLREILITCQHPIDFYDCATNIPFPVYHPPCRVGREGGMVKKKNVKEEISSETPHAGPSQDLLPHLNGTSPTSVMHANSTASTTPSPSRIPSPPPVMDAKKNVATLLRSTYCWPLDVVDQFLEYVQLVQVVSQWITWQFAPGASASRTVPLKKSYLLGDTPPSAQVPDNLTAGQALNFLWHLTELVCAYRALVVPGPVEARLRFIASRYNGKHEIPSTEFLLSALVREWEGSSITGGQGLPPLVLTSSILHPLLLAYGLPASLYDVFVRTIESEPEQSEARSPHRRHHHDQDDSSGDGRVTTRGEEHPVGQFHPAQKFWRKCFRRVRREISTTSTSSLLTRKKDNTRGMEMIPNPETSMSCSTKGEAEEVPVTQDDGEVLVQRIFPHLFLCVSQDRRSSSEARNTERALDHRDEGKGEKTATLSLGPSSLRPPSLPPPAPPSTNHSDSAFSYSVLPLSVFQRYFFCGQKSIVFLRDKVFQEEEAEERTGGGGEKHGTRGLPTTMSGSKRRHESPLLSRHKNKWALLGDVVFGQYGLGIFPFQIPPLRKLGFSMDDVAMLTVSWVTETCARIGVCKFFESVPLGAFFSTFLLLSEKSLLKAIVDSPLAMVSDSREELEQTCWRVEALLVICLVRCVGLCRKGKGNVTHFHTSSRTHNGRSSPRLHRRPHTNWSGFKARAEERDKSGFFSREEGHGYSLLGHENVILSGSENFEPLPSSLKEYIAEVAKFMAPSTLPQKSFHERGERSTHKHTDPRRRGSSRSRRSSTNSRSSEGSERIRTTIPTVASWKMGSNRKGIEKGEFSKSSCESVGGRTEKGSPNTSTTTRSPSVSITLLREKEKSRFSPHPFFVCLRQCIRLWLVLTDEVDTLLISHETMKEVEVLRGRKQEKGSHSPLSTEGRVFPHRLVPFRLSMLFTSSVLANIQSPLSTTIEEYLLEATGMDFPRVHRLHVYFAGTMTQKERNQAELVGKAGESEEKHKESTPSSVPPGNQASACGGFSACRKEKGSLNYWQLAELMHRCGVPDMFMTTQHFKELEEEYTKYSEEKEILQRIRERSGGHEDVSGHYGQHKAKASTTSTSNHSSCMTRDMVGGFTASSTPITSSHSNSSQYGRHERNRSQESHRSPSPSISPSRIHAAGGHAPYAAAAAASSSDCESSQRHSCSPEPLPYTSSYASSRPWPWIKAEGQWSHEAFDAQVRVPLWSTWQSLSSKMSPPTPTSTEQGRAQVNSSGPLLPTSPTVLPPQHHNSSSFTELSDHHPSMSSESDSSNRVVVSATTAAGTSPSSSTSRSGGGNEDNDGKIGRKGENKEIKSTSLLTHPLPSPSASPSTIPLPFLSVVGKADHWVEDTAHIFAQCCLFIGFLSIVEELLSPLLSRLGIFWDTNTIPRLDFLSVLPAHTTAFSSSPPSSPSSGRRVASHHSRHHGNSDRPEHSTSTTRDGVPSHLTAASSSGFSSSTSASRGREESGRAVARRDGSSPPALHPAQPPFNSSISSKGSVEKGISSPDMDAALSASRGGNPTVEPVYHNALLCLSGTRAVEAYLTSLMDMLECVSTMHHALGLDATSIPWQLVHILVTHIFNDDRQAFRSIPTGLRDRLFLFLFLLENTPKRIQVMVVQYMRLLHLVQYFMRSSQLQVEGIPVQFFSFHMPWKALIGPLDALHFLPSRHEVQRGGGGVPYPDKHSNSLKKESQKHKTNKSLSSHHCAASPPEASALTAVFKAAGWTPVLSSHGSMDGRGPFSVNHLHGISPHDQKFGDKALFGKVFHHLQEEKDRWNLIVHTLRQFVVDGILLPVMDKLSPAAANLLFQRHSYNGGVTVRRDGSDGGGGILMKKSTTSAWLSSYRRPSFFNDGVSVPRHVGSYGKRSTSTSSSTPVGYSVSLPAVHVDKKGNSQLSHALQIPAFDNAVLQRLQRPETYLIIVQLAAVLGLNENLAALIILDFHLKYLSDMPYIVQQIHFEKNNSATAHLVRSHLQKMLYVVYDFIETCDNNPSALQGPRRAALLEARRQLGLSPSFKEWLKLPRPEMDPSHPHSQIEEGNILYGAPLHMVQWHPTAEKESNETVSAYTARRAQQLKVLEEGVNWFTPLELSAYSTLIHTIISSHAPDTIDRLKNTLLHLKDVVFTLASSSTKVAGSEMEEFNIIERFGVDILCLIEMIVSTI